jgi:DNA-binding Xre family transcriptional regulator
MERRWNNREAAEACGISQSRYGEIIDGTAKRIFLDTIDRLCKGFGVERDVLLKDVELATEDQDIDE